MKQKEALQARVNRLKELYKTRLGESENPRSNPQLRSVRKKMKRVQRKLRLVQAAEQKGHAKATATE